MPSMAESASAVTLTVRHDVFPVRGGFTISRGSRTQADVVVAELGAGTLRGRGECLPYPRYGESVEGVMQAIEALAAALAEGLSRQVLQDALPPGAARNALDCAFWDLEAKRSGRRVWQLAGLPKPEPLLSAYTLSVDEPAAMARAAAETLRPLLKLKLAGRGDLERVSAVHAAAPGSRIIVDANEGWSLEDYRTLTARLESLGVEMIEQPLPSGQDEALRGEVRPIKLCADESCHDQASLAALGGKYDMVNIKLDKAGGLTEALALREAAEAAGFEIMVGSMLASSLAVAPAVLLAQGAAIADLDGPLLLARDREPPIKFEGSVIHPPEPALWG